ncbi:hypothetical protein GA0115254_118526 [Streptomyces sp. Ncost-T10-10d]|nr:hypothetical protein GA0115254_118526 [Streptomyces sp. Ncost-T10-10d]
MQPDVTRTADVLARGSDHQVGETVSVQVGRRQVAAEAVTRFRRAGYPVAVLADHLALDAVGAVGHAVDDSEVPGAGPAVDSTAWGGDRHVGVSVTVEVGPHGRRGIDDEGARRGVFGVGHRRGRPRHGDDRGNSGGGHTESPGGHIKPLGMVSSWPRFSRARQPTRPAQGAKGCTPPPHMPTTPLRTGEIAKHAAALEARRKLREQGVIRATTVDVDPAALDRGILAFVLVDSTAWMGDRAEDFAAGSAHGTPARSAWTPRRLCRTPAAAPAPRTMPPPWGSRGEPLCQGASPTAGAVGRACSTQMVLPVGV